MATHRWSDGDLEEFQDTLAAVYADYRTAVTVLRRIGYPAGRIPPASMSLNFWDQALGDLREGLLEDGLWKLLIVNIHVVCDQGMRLGRAGYGRGGRVLRGRQGGAAAGGVQGVPA
uniref:effector-associated domain EAD1-containing protein n=1 Tax=Frankia tisae TaxID=2950104 RepID=UPI0021C07812